MHEYCDLLELWCTWVGGIVTMFLFVSYNYVFSTVVPKVVS